jgi:hypothetical protein
MAAVVLRRFIDTSDDVERSDGAAWATFVGRGWPWRRRDVARNGRRSRRAVEQGDEAGGVDRRPVQVGRRRGDRALPGAQRVVEVMDRVEADVEAEKGEGDRERERDPLSPAQAEDDHRAQRREQKHPASALSGRQIEDRRRAVVSP